MAARVGLVILLGVLATASASGSNAPGSSPFPSGWIVAAITPRGGIENAELFRIRTDGTGLHQLTHSRVGESDPSFAPNGKRVVFTRSRRGIFTIGLGGSGLRRLTTSAYDEHPVYSPDGTRIAFLRANRLYVMQADGRRERLLRRAPRLSLRPSWSPDGKKVMAGAGDNTDAVLYTLDARTGRILKRALLMEGDLAAGLSEALLAPDGRTLVFDAYRPPPENCQGIQCEVYALYRRTLARGISSTGVVCNDCSADAWSGDGRVLLITRKQGQLELRVVRDGRTKLVDLHGYQGYIAAPATLQPR